MKLRVQLWLANQITLDQLPVRARLLGNYKQQALHFEELVSIRCKMKSFIN